MAAALLAKSSEILRMSASLLLMAAEIFAISATLSAMPLVLTRTKIKINTQKLSFLPGLFSSLYTYMLLMAAALLAKSSEIL
jgi:hypothetical protein